MTSSTWEPEAATTRLAKTAGANPAGVFTSDLSVSEYVLLGEAGFEPLGFVIGSSIYHIGMQIGRWRQNQELQVLTQAMYNARDLAMSRMRAEADHLGADGIVGVNLRMQMYSWGQGCLEFVAAGTAVRHLAGQGAHRAPDGRVPVGDERLHLAGAEHADRMAAPQRPRHSINGRHREAQGRRRVVPAGAAGRAAPPGARSPAVAPTLSNG